MDCSKMNEYIINLLDERKLTLTSLAKQLKMNVDELADALSSSINIDLYDQIAVDPDSGVHISVAPNEIENSFIELEGEYSTVVSKIEQYLKISNDFELTLFETSVLNKFMASLIFRNPIFIDIIKTFVNLLSVDCLA